MSLSRSWKLLAVLFISFALRAYAFSDPEHWRSRNLEIVDEVARIVEENYYDPKLKNVDWKAAVRLAKDRIKRAENEGQMSAAIVGLLARLDDSHTYYLRPYRLEPVIFGFDAKSFGDESRVYEIMPGGPAEQTGLQLGDRIVGVQGFEADRKSIDAEMRYFQYIDPSLTLKLTVVRNGQAPKDYLITGKQPGSSTKEFRKLYRKYSDDKDDEEENPKVRLEDGIAYVRFPSFEVSGSKASSILEVAAKARAVILDLRDNGGGREDTMKEMVGHFFSEPDLLVTAISRRKTEKIVFKPKKPNLTAPLYVLTDSHSASASEVFARFMQLKKRATIIGDRSAGKVNRAMLFGGIGGMVYMIPFGVVVTISRAVMPDGGELEGNGVVPDVPCVPSEEDLRKGHDICLEQAFRLARQTGTQAAQIPTP